MRTFLTITFTPALFTLACCVPAPQAPYRSPQGARIAQERELARERAELAVERAEVDLERSVVREEEVDMARPQGGGFLAAVEREIQRERAELAVERAEVRLEAAEVREEEVDFGTGRFQRPRRRY